MKFTGEYQSGASLGGDYILKLIPANTRRGERRAERGYDDRDLMIAIKTRAATVRGHESFGFYSNNQPAAYYCWLPFALRLAEKTDGLVLTGKKIVTGIGI